MGKIRRENRAPGRTLTAASAVAACVLAIAILLAPGAGAAPAGEPSATTGNVIVMVSSPGAVGDGTVADPSSRAGELRAERRIESLVERNDLDVATELPELGAVAVSPATGEGAAELIDRLEGQPGVVSVQPEYRRQLRYSPNDPGFAGSDPNSPRTTRQWNLIYEYFRKAWTYSRGSDVTVAVIDTGIDGGHPEFRSKIRFSADRDANHSTPATYDDYGHGTHVAGLACAAGNNSYGIVGAGFNCKLGIEKTDLTDSSIANSIRHATDRGARVINMSFGSGGESTVMESAINYAWGKGVVMVAAASNRFVQDQGYPAKYLQPNGTAQDLGSGKGLVVTGAYHNNVNAGTGHGSGVSMAAYGFSRGDLPGIFSTFPRNQTELDESCLLELVAICVGPDPGCGCRTSFNGSNGWAYLQGTSMATPQVAGAAALIRHLRPRLSARRVLTILKAQARGTYSDQLGWGILDAGAAVVYARKKYRR